METVLAHLEAGCGRCEGELEPLVSFLVIEDRAPASVEETHYDGAVRSAFAAVRKRSRELAAERAAAPRIARALVAELGAGGGRFTDLPVESQRRLATWERVRGAADQSAALRLTTRRARCAPRAPRWRWRPARRAALRPRPAADLQARAWAELGNAYASDDQRRPPSDALREPPAAARGTGAPTLPPGWPS